MDFQLQVTQLDSYCRVLFPAMASPCELLLDAVDAQLALQMGQMVQAETKRIEQKFSRYRDDNLIHEINHSSGRAVALDDETADLIDFADKLYALSAGRFDITSGLLRKVWTFDGSDRVPDAAAIDALLCHIGWQKVGWHRPKLSLPVGMEIDLGGIAKEYAVDKVYGLLREHYPGAFLVNFGGDLRAHGPRADGSVWQVGISEMQARRREHCIELKQGALATSGDAERFIEKNGVRYGHILDPRSGWPVVNAPHAITVFAPTCVQAGVLSTLAILMGEEAEAFLQQQNVRFWSLRE